MSENIPTYVPMPGKVWLGTLEERHRQKFTSAVRYALERLPQPATVYPADVEARVNLTYLLEWLERP